MSHTNSDNKKRVAKNTIFLYIRMFISIIVSLYTSRIVLNVLGIEDYGIYGVVGGVVSLFTFLNSSMSSATSRFLTFELGRENLQQLKVTFSAAFIIHLILSILILILAETVGLWFLINKLVIPENRLFAAHIVYQLSILSMLVGVTQVPYNACIIAHERMDVYAYVELFNVILKLLIVFLLTIGHYDKLILYSILVFLVSLSTAIVYRFFCIRHFKESHLMLVYKFNVFRPLLSFSSWNIYGCFCVSLRQQGINILINMFYGAAFNAAASIATTIQGLIMGLSSNVTLAFKPQIVKKYATNDFVEMQSLLLLSLKLTLTIFGVICVPLYLNLPYILHLWLGTVPDYTVDFLRLILISSLFTLMSNIFTDSIHATGNIKGLSFITGSWYVLSLIPMYYFLSKGSTANIVYIIFCCTAFLILLTNIFVLSRKLKQINVFVLIKIVLLNIICFTACILSVYCIVEQLNSELLRLVSSGLLSVCIYLVSFYFVLLNKQQRVFFKNFVLEKIKNH